MGIYIEEMDRAGLNVFMKVIRYGRSYLRTTKKSLSGKAKHYAEQCDTNSDPGAALQFLAIHERAKVVECDEVKYESPFYIEPD